MPAAFTDLAGAPDPRLDELSLAMAAEFREVDAGAALTRLDALGAELAPAAAGTPEEQAQACAEVLGTRHGFAGDAERYDDPRNSMLDVVLERRRGLPILLSVVYVEVARRAGIALAGIGLPGHFVVGHLGTAPPLLLDPFAGGALVEGTPPAEVTRPWTAQEIAMRMLNNLVSAFDRRGNLAAGLRAAELRRALAADEQLRESLQVQLRALRARLN